MAAQLGTRGPGKGNKNDNGIRQRPFPLLASPPGQVRAEQGPDKKHTKYWQQTGRISLRREKGNRDIDTQDAEQETRTNRDEGKESFPEPFLKHLRI